MNSFNSGQKQAWAQCLKALGSTLLSIRPDSNWTTRQDLKSTLDRVLERVESDLKILKSEALFLFDVHADVERSTQNTVELLRRWTLQGNPPSIPALCIFVIEQMGLSLKPDILHGLLGAAVLAEVENTHPYHNNMHFRKVVLQAIRLITLHNDIFKETPRAFDEAQTALILLAACIHDLGHDGKGNTVKGLFQQGRLEQRSYDLALPFLEGVGFSDPDQLESLQVMLLCTDVTPLDDPSSPMCQMKAAYRFHYLGEKKQTDSLNLDKNIVRLQNDKYLSMMSLILQEADIATSAGLSYELTQYETALHRQEIEAHDAAPAHILDFLEGVCHRRMLSDAGQRLFTGNMARIHALAEQGIRDGNHPFPKPEYCDFVLSHRVSGEAGELKTLN